MSEVPASAVSVPPPPKAEWKPKSGIVLRHSDIAALRVNGKVGAAGNEVILRSGVAIPLDYEVATDLACALCAASDFVGEQGRLEHNRPVEPLMYAHFR